ncbi:MAG: hypothetical protein ACI945_002231, partial [Pseudohongiellaceae bacterium]
DPPPVGNNLLLLQPVDFVRITLRLAQQMLCLFFYISLFFSVSK